MTESFSEEIQKTAQALAALYANWPGCRAWVDNRVSPGGRCRMRPARSMGSRGA